MMEGGFFHDATRTPHLCEHGCLWANVRKTSRRENKKSDMLNVRNPFRLTGGRNEPITGIIGGAENH